MTTHNLIREHEQSPHLGAVVTLFEIDMSIFNAGVFYLVQAAEEYIEDGAVEVRALRFGGIEYSPHPILMTGIERTTEGPLPRPTLRVGNAAGILTSLMVEHDDLRGATVRRIVTYDKFLDGKPEANKNAHRPVEEYKINRKASHSTHTQVVEFELIAAIDQETANLPRGICLREFCSLIYRVPDGAGGFITDNTDEACPYAEVGEGAYFDANNQPVATAAEDRCSQTLAGCTTRFGTDQLPFGGFPGMARLRLR